MKPASAEELDRIALHFIVGMGRSGTTLLTSILNNHPELLSTPENNFLVFNLAAFKNSGFQENDAKLLSRSLTYRTSKTLKIWHPTPEYVDSLFNRFKNLNFNRVCKALYLFYPLAEKKNNLKCIIDKNPEYSLHVHELKKQFPDSKFIILIRDPRANIASRKKVDRSLLKSITILAESWNCYYRRLLKFSAEYPERALLVKYEDLANDPTAQVSRICEFIGVPFREDLLSTTGNFKDNFIVAGVKLKEQEKTRIETMHTNLEKEINSKKIDSWKNELSAGEARLIEFLCRPLAEKFYRIDTDSTSGQKLWLFLKTFPLVVFTRLYLYLVNYKYYYLPLRMRLLFEKPNEQ